MNSANQCIVMNNKPDIWPDIKGPARPLRCFHLSLLGLWSGGALLELHEATKLHEPMRMIKVESN